MLANFFGKSKPVNFILIIMLFLGYCMLDVFVYNPQAFSFELLLVLPLFLGVFFLFNFILAKNKLTYDNSFAFLLFVIGLGFLSKMIYEPKEVLVFIILFLFFRRVYSLRTLKMLYAKLFDSGFWLGILLLFFPYYLLYTVLIYAAILLFIKPTFRTVVIPIIGVITPLFLFFTYHFYMDSITVFYELFSVNFSSDFTNFSSHIYLFFFAFFGGISLLSIFLKSGKIFSVNNKFKKSWGLLLVHFVIATSMVFLCPQQEEITLFTFLIPSTIIITNWIQTVKKKFIVNLVLFLFLVTSILIHFL